MLQQKVPMSCKWLLFLPHHASCWRATRFNGGLQRGCLPAPHRGLCAVTLRLPGLEGGVRARLGVGKEGKNSEPGEPPVDLGFFLHPPTFSTFRFFFPAKHCFSLLFSTTSLTKLDARTTGPRPRTGVSQPAYQRLPRRSPDTVMAHERRKRDPKKTEQCPF